MPRLSTGALVAGGLATVLALCLAWPVVVNPSHLIYGREIVGRQPDIYTAIAQYGDRFAVNLNAQAVTDVLGWLLARVVPPVAAFNVVMLLTFSLGAMAAYALARYVTGSHGASLVAALAYAASPAHLAHLAYHPYVAQIQWLPLFVLVLIAFVDRASWQRAIGLLAASAGLVLASSSAGFIGAVVAPVILVAFWAIRLDADKNPRPLIVTGLVLGVAAAAGAVLVWFAQPEWFGSSQPFPIDNVAFYRAQWFAYLIPPVDHALLGEAAQHFWNQRNVTLQLTEDQLYLGYGLLVLAAVALATAGVRWFSQPRLRALIAIGVVGLVAALISIGPTSGSCAVSLAPGCLIFRVAPLFRAYARFGLLVQLAVAILAGAGVAMLSRQSTTGRAVAAGLLLLTVFEYRPLPARAHDVLPTEAHRFLASEPAGHRILDCYPGSRTEVSIPALMQRSLSFLDDAVPSCGDPQLGVKLTALGFTHVLVRHGAVASGLSMPLPPGISLERRFPDADVYAVSASLPPIVTVSSSGFYGHEHSDDDWWQWMGPRGQWIVRNTTTMPQRVSLSLDLVSVGFPRELVASLDGASHTETVGMERRVVTVGPWTIGPGEHAVTFSANGDPIRPADVESSRDTRLLTIAFRDERWVMAP